VRRTGERWRWDLNRWMVTKGWAVAHERYSLDYVAEDGDDAALPGTRSAAECWRHWGWLSECRGCGAGPRRARRRRRAPVLAIGSHDWRSCRSPKSGIADPAAVLTKEAGTASWVPAGTPRLRFDKYFDQPRGRYPEQSETEETAELVHARVALAATALGRTHRKPDLIAGSRSIYTRSTSSRLKASLSSPITTIGGSSPRSATRSQPQTSPLTVKPSASR
jgi:hypothetical protein